MLDWCSEIARSDLEGALERFHSATRLSEQLDDVLARMGFLGEVVDADHLFSESPSDLIAKSSVEIAREAHRAWEPHRFDWLSEPEDIDWNDAVPRETGQLMSRHRSLSWIRERLQDGSREETASILMAIMPESDPSHYAAALTVAKLKVEVELREVESAVFGALYSYWLDHSKRMIALDSCLEEGFSLDGHPQAFQDNVESFFA